MTTGPLTAVTAGADHSGSSREPGNGTLHTADTRPPRVGDVVHVRTRTWIVEEVRPGRGGHVVRLACLDDDAQGMPLETLWQIELDARIVGEDNWKSIGARGFDDPRLFAAFVNTVRWNCVTATRPNLFQSPFRAGIRIDPYQLEPLQKALRLPRVNMFIADDVGLGKTIEAGLITIELLLRRRIRNIVVACPPSMIPQWRDELESRFGLTFEHLNREYVKRVREERGYGVNPWKTFPRFLVSHNLLIDETYTATLRDWLGGFLPGTLFILDEAHHAAPSSGAKYAIDSKITRAVRDLATRFEHRLFLSATPHNGHSNSFSALLEILDPERFCRGVRIVKSNLESTMVRRIKDDVREVAGGFPKRHVEQIDLTGLPKDAPELVLSRLLNEYRDVRARRVEGATKKQQARAFLLISGLQQRLLSSTAAFARTLATHRRTMEKIWARELDEARTADRPGAGAKATTKASSPVSAANEDPTSLLGFDDVDEDHTDAAADADGSLASARADRGARRRSLLTNSLDADDDRAELDEDELHALEDAEVDAATAATAGDRTRADRAREEHLLNEMQRITEGARAKPDARVYYLINWIKAHMCGGAAVPFTGPDAQRPKAGAQWTDARIIIFTEWEDTLHYLWKMLNAAIAGTDLAEHRIERFFGRTGPKDRERIKKAFNTPPAQHPVRILLATDAAREGLNLQAHCHHLFHFDVPWNPSRLEQRNGRIDRKLQPSPNVYCHYFVYAQRPEDRVLQVLVRKTKTIREELGSLSQVLEARLANTLRHGIRHADTDRIVTALEGADLDDERKSVTQDELEAARQRQDVLRDQVDTLARRVEDARKWIGLDNDAFRDALSCALELNGAAPLREDPPGAGRFIFPEIRSHHGGDPGWQSTLDTLRALPDDGERDHRWRRDAPIRPIVFDPPSTVDDSVVQLHLQHRVSQRLLGRFLAQGFVHHDLSRACITQAADRIPRVVVLGRLSLYGPGASRLHEEVLTVTARWTDPASRTQPLAPYARDAEARTMELLEHALRPGGRKAVPDVRARRFLQSIHDDLSALLPHLKARGDEATEAAKALLNERGRTEAKHMHDVLEEQRRRIEIELGKPAEKQLPLFASADEKRTYESNRRYWQRWLATANEKLEEEPARILRFYHVESARCEPLGVVYLVPQADADAADD